MLSRVKQSQEGFALVTVLMLLLIMTLVSIALYQSTALELLIYGNVRTIAKTNAAADACSKVASDRSLAGDLNGQTLTSGFVPQCRYSDFSVSTTGKPKIGDSYSGPKAYYLRTNIEAWRNLNPLASAAANQDRIQVIQQWQ